MVSVSLTILHTPKAKAVNHTPWYREDLNIHSFQDSPLAQVPPTSPPLRTGAFLLDIWG